MIRAVILAIIVFSLQISFFGYLEIYHVAANIFLVSLVMAALYFKFDNFSYFAFFIAILNDIYSDSFFGFFLLYALVFSFMVYYLKESVFKKFNYVLGMFLLVAADLILIVQKKIAAWIMPLQTNFPAFNAKGAIIEFFYSAALFLFLYFAVEFLKKKKKF